MNIIYTWNILSLDTYNTYLQDSDFVYAVQWKLTGKKYDDILDPEDKSKFITTEVKSAYIYDKIGFSHNPNNPYIPRSQLSDEQVIEWVKQSLGHEKIAELELRIKNMLLECE